MKNINKQNYPSIMVLWVLTSIASSFLGLVMSSMTLLFAGVASILLATIYVTQMPNPQRRLTI
jgi:hypothetical protein